MYTVHVHYLVHLSSKESLAGVRFLEPALVAHVTHSCRQTELVDEGLVGDEAALGKQEGVSPRQGLVLGCAPPSDTLDVILLGALF